MLCWPSDAEDVIRLHDHGVPCLLLLDAAADPPDLGSLLVDWVRLPADDRDLTARLSRLRRHAAAPAVLPTLDGYGRLTFGDRWVELTPIEERLAEALIESFATVVPGPVLAARGWPGAPPSINALRVNLHRMRRRVESIGLEVRMLRGSGYLLQIADAPPGRPTDRRRPTAAADRRPVAASAAVAVISAAAAGGLHRAVGARHPTAARRCRPGHAGVLVIAVALVPFHATVPRPIPIVLLLLPVVAAGVVGGRLAAGAVTVEAVAVLATGFLPPVFSPRVTLAEDIAGPRRLLRGRGRARQPRRPCRRRRPPPHRARRGQGAGARGGRPPAPHPAVLGLPRPAHPAGHDPRRRHRPLVGCAARRVDPHRAAGLGGRRVRAARPHRRQPAESEPDRGRHVLARSPAGRPDRPGADLDHAARRGSSTASS